MTEHEFEVFYSNLQLISYAVMIAVLILLPLIVGAVLKAKNCGATRRQLIILCISSCILSIGLPHLAGYLYMYSASGVKPTSELLLAILQWANPLYAVPASVLAYVFLSKTLIFRSETEKDSLEKDRSELEQIRIKQNKNPNAYPWYTVGDNLPAGYITVIRTAEPACVDVAVNNKSYSIPLMEKRESIVVRDGEKYRPLNCYFKNFTSPKSNDE